MGKQTDTGAVFPDNNCWTMTIEQLNREYHEDFGVYRCSNRVTFRGLVIPDACPRWAIEDGSYVRGVLHAATENVVCISRITRVPSTFGVWEYEALVIPNEVKSEFGLDPGLLVTNAERRITDLEGRIGAVGQDGTIMDRLSDVEQRVSGLYARMYEISRMLGSS